MYSNIVCEILSYVYVFLSSQSRIFEKMADSAKGSSFLDILADLLFNERKKKENKGFMRFEFIVFRLYQELWAATNFVKMQKMRSVHPFSF